MTQDLFLESLVRTFFAFFASLRETSSAHFARIFSFSDFLQPEG